MSKNITRLVIGVGLMALTYLVACGEAERSIRAAVDIEQVDPSDQEVVFWYQHSRQREEALIELIDEYNRTNAHGIKVRGEYMGGYDDIYKKMFVGLQGGTLPQLVVAYQNQALAYFEADGVIDIAPYMNSKKWGLSATESADFIQAFLQQDNNKGVQTGFPPNRSMEVLYYNLDWLKELGYARPPVTWDEFADMCRKAQAQPFSKSTDKERSLGFFLELDASRLATMVFTRGGDFMNADRTAYTFNTPQVRQALQLMQDLIQEKAVDIVSERYMDQQEFGVGKALFVLRSTSGLPFFKSAVADGLDFAWSVSAPPRQVDDPVVNVYGASLSLCRTTPAQQLATWLFVKWFTQPQQQARWARASNYFPVRKSTANELKEYLVENPGYAAAFKLLDYGKSEPAVQGYQPVREMIAAAMVDIAEGGDLDGVLSRLERQANKTLERF